MVGPSVSSIPVTLDFLFAISLICKSELYSKRPQSSCVISIQLDLKLVSCPKALTLFAKGYRRDTNTLLRFLIVTEHVVQMRSFENVDPLDPVEFRSVSIFFSLQY